MEQEAEEKSYYSRLTRTDRRSQTPDRFDAFNNNNGSTNRRRMNNPLR
jgi:hypothetical protein